MEFPCHWMALEHPVALARQEGPSPDSSPSHQKVNSRQQGAVYHSGEPPPSPGRKKQSSYLLCSLGILRMDPYVPVASTFCAKWLEQQDPTLIQGAQSETSTRHHGPSFQELMLRPSSLGGHRHVSSVVASSTRESVYSLFTTTRNYCTIRRLEK